MTSYPAITIWQPWASLIAAGAKRFEFRLWAPPPDLVGKRIAVHAAARQVQQHEVQALIYNLRSKHTARTGIDPAIGLPLLDRIANRPSDLPLASVLCLATLGTPLRDADLITALGAFTSGSVSCPDAWTGWGWPLMDIEVLTPPIAARGEQRFWTWTMPHA